MHKTYFAQVWSPILGRISQSSTAVTAMSECFVPATSLCPLHLVKLVSTTRTTILERAATSLLHINPVYKQPLHTQYNVQGPALEEAGLAWSPRCAPVQRGFHKSPQPKVSATTCSYIRAQNTMSKKIGELHITCLSGHTAQHRFKHIKRHLQRSQKERTLQGPTFSQDRD